MILDECAKLGNTNICFHVEIMGRLKNFEFQSKKKFGSGHNGSLKVRLTLVEKLDKSFPLTKLLALMSRGSIQFDTGALGNLLLP